jgi:uncharacterized membrane protein
MTSITQSITINTGLDGIRPYYAHPDHTPEWAQVMYLWEPDEAWPSAGATARMGLKSGGFKIEGTATTLEYDPETMRHHFRLEPADMEPMQFWYTFEEGEGETTVTARVDYTIPGSYLGQILDKLFVERQNSRDMADNLRRLKEMAEGAA